MFKRKKMLSKVPTGSFFSTERNPDRSSVYQRIGSENPVLLLNCSGGTSEAIQDIAVYPMTWEKAVSIWEEMK